MARAHRAPEVWYSIGAATQAIHRPTTTPLCVSSHFPSAFLRPRAANQVISFIFDLGNTALANAENIALHWAMSCANDTIEGQQYVPEPATLALMLPALFALRRRVKN